MPLQKYSFLLLNGNVWNIDWHRLILCKKNQSQKFLLEITRLETLTQHAVDIFIDKVIINSTQSIEIIWKGKDLYEGFATSD